MEPRIRDYYEHFDEDARLRTGPERLELLRTQDILRRHLPPAPARVLDVGGASGVHAEWLAADGYDVRLIDPVPSHVEQAARLDGVAAELGDARTLPAGDSSYDVVLLLGPLYHLTARHDRLAALGEARRVVRPGGLVAVAGISRYASLFDTLRLGIAHLPHVRPVVEGALEDGGHLPPADWRMFTTAYFHHPTGLGAEITESELELDGVLPTEGPAFLLGDLERLLDEPEQRDRLLWSLRQIERDASLTAASSHLLALARRSSRGDAAV